MCQGDTTMSMPVGKDADSNNGGQTSAAIAAEARRKSFKRALKGTVGTGLVAVSAALIARSDDIGEWLQSVAPNVLPHNEAGMDIVLRAIAEAKGCWEKGANVCLDAEGRVTALYAFLAQWYLSPRQHVVELAYSILILSPLVYLYWKLCRSRVSLQRATASFDFKRPNLLMKLWGASLLALMLAGAFLKFYKWELISHPAYLWQPCHVHSLVMGLCAFVPTERSLLVLHVATTLWWGPFLAFVAPSLPTDPVEIALFWAQHALMLLAPLVRLMVGTRWMYRDFWWNSVGFVFLSCYHFWLLAPINIFTGVNVATMTVPPASLEMFGKYYRPMWSVVCGLLQLAAVGVMGALAGLFGQWPPSSLSQTCGEGKSTTSASASTGLASEAMTAPASSSGGKVSDDAVPVSPEKAVSLGDAE